MEKIKRLITNSTESSKGKDVLAVFIIVMVGVGSFGLGRLSTGGPETKISVTESSLANVTNALAEIPEVQTGEEQKETSEVVTKAKETETKKITKTAKIFFASSRGSKYYHPGCTGGKTLKKENKIWFATKEEAETAGYELSSSCKQ